MTTNERELRESEYEWGRFNTEIARRELSRRRVLTGAAALGLVATGGFGALLGACGDDSGATATATTSGTTAAGGTAAPTVSAGITGDWDTTGLPPYKQGLPDAKANPPADWKIYPWYYKYGPWRYNWDIPVYRGGHIIVETGVPANYDIMITGNAAAPVYNRLFNAGLREGLDLTKATLEPELAIGQEHSPDYTSWTFKLPQNAKFHNKAPVNGRQMKAADVVFSFETHLKNNVSKAALANIAKISAPDDYTVKFDLKQPWLTFPATLTSNAFEVFAKEHYENQDVFKKTPIGTGPFMLDFWEFQNRVDYVRNPEYWEKMPIKQEKYGTAALPLADKYTQQYFANSVAAHEAFYNGQIDHDAPGGGLDVNLIKQQLQRAADIIIMTNPYWSCCPWTMNFQYKNPLFQDIRVRQALSMGINRQAVWEKGADRTGAPGSTPIPNDLAGYTVPPPVSSYGPNAQYDPAKAKALLKEAGLTPPIKFQIYQTAQSNQTWQNTMDAVVFGWRQDGVADAQFVIRDGQVFTLDTTKKTFPDAYMSIGGLASGVTIDTMVTPKFVKDSPANYGSLEDPKLEDLLKQWSLATDPAKGVDLARQMTKQINDNVDNLWFGWIGGMDQARSWLHGTVMTPHAQPNGIALQSRKYIWIDDTAPGGRGGKKV